MEQLRVQGTQIVTASGRPFWLRGACVGGWMNMEEFINGYPGSEHGLRLAMARRLGAETARQFFDRLLDHFFDEADVRYLASLGTTAVRLPLNYRHFESDDHPFTYLEDGFARLDRALGWCEAHGLYAVLDLHAVQGWQNPDWHCDNSTRHTMFWKHPHFQDRFVALWEEFARRYRGRAVIAGYDVMNEPVSNAPFGRFSERYEPDWEAVNRVYRRVTSGIRAIDPDHIIFLEGDLFSREFDGLDAPFAENLVYSSHQYTDVGFGPGPYPGTFKGSPWNLERQRQAFEETAGLRFARRHGVPLWVSEFGAAYNGPAHEIPDRLRALDDQLAVYNAAGAHWSMWTYKDIHVMGWVQVAPDSAYLQAIRSVLDAKRDLATDFWMGWIPPTPVKQRVFDLASQIAAAIPDPTIDLQANEVFLSQAALSGYAAALMQPLYAACFAGLGPEELERAAESFALGRCRPHAALIETIRRHL